MNNRNFTLRQPRRSRQAFTLIEVLVALGILAILLVIIVLPLRLGFDTFNAGNAQSLTQSALQATMTDMEKDMRQAVYVFPNAQVVGVTDKAPYAAPPAQAGNPPISLPPYFRSKQDADTGDPTAATTAKACGSVGNTTAIHWSNPARLDMILVRRDAVGNILTPVKPSYTIVSYYARRQQLDKPYDPIDNPVVMYRAEYPAFAVRADGTPIALILQNTTNTYNAKADFKRALDAADCSDAGAANRSALWLTHNVFGEANLLPLTNPAMDDKTYPQPPNSNVSYSHTLAIPRGLALQASNAYRATIPVPTTPAFDPSKEAPLVPDTSFTCTDTNNDGKIDRITISLALASFDTGAQGQLDQNFQPKGTVLRGTRTVDLPNIQ